MRKSIVATSKFSTGRRPGPVRPVRIGLAHLAERLMRHVEEDRDEAHRMDGEIIERAIAGGSFAAP